MQPYSLTNFETHKYQNEHRFDQFYLRNNLPKIKDGAYVINLGEYKLIGTHWTAFYADASNNIL